MSRIAFSPGSVTCFFDPRQGGTPATTVSRGCAVNLRHGVVGGIETAGATEVLLNGEAIHIPPVQKIIQQIAPEPVRVTLETPLRIGCGFGVSASAALVTAFSLSKYFSLGMSRDELGSLAHFAEVECETGIGDVSAQLEGGVVHRRCADGPFDCRQLRVEDEVMHYRVFGSISTTDVLKSDASMARLRREGAAALAWLEHRAEHSVRAILDRSLQGCERAGMVQDPRVRDAIDDVRARGGAATMILLGHSVLACGMEQAASDGWIACGIDFEGTRYLCDDAHP